MNPQSYQGLLFEVHVLLLSVTDIKVVSYQSVNTLPGGLGPYTAYWPASSSDMT